MATVEEIVVKFTGDASGMATAVDRARAKVKDLEKSIMATSNLLERAAPGSRAFDANEAVLRKLVDNWGKASEKLQRETAKIEKAMERTTKAVGGPGGGSTSVVGGGLGITGSFGAGAGIAAMNQIIRAMGPLVKEVGMNALGAGEKYLSGSSMTYAQAERMQEEEDDRASRLSRLRNRQIGDMTQGVSRETAGRSSLVQLEAQIALHSKLAKQMAESQLQQERYRKSMAENDSVMSRARAAEFETAKRGLAEETKHYEALENAAHAAGEKIKDLKSQRWLEVQSARQATQDLGMSMAERTLLLNNPDTMDARDIAMMRERKKIRERIERDNPNATAANREKMIANELEQLERQRELEKAAEKSSVEEDFLKKQQSKVRSFGRTAAESFLLERMAIGKEVDPERAAEIIGAENQYRAMSLKQQLETPFERGQRELEDLQALRGTMDPETYYRAVARIQKGMAGPGPAASRAAVGFGSAEHTARIMQYQRVLDEPQAMANNIERANREKSPENKAQSEANMYLRQIRDKLGNTPSIQLKAANLGGG